MMKSLDDDAELSGARVGDGQDGPGGPVKTPGNDNKVTQLLPQPDGAAEGMNSPFNSSSMSSSSSNAKSTVLQAPQEPRSDSVETRPSGISTKCEPSLAVFKVDAGTAVSVTKQTAALSQPAIQTSKVAKVSLVDDDIINGELFRDFLNDTVYKRYDISVRTYHIFNCVRLI